MTPAPQVTPDCWFHGGLSVFRSRLEQLADDKLRRWRSETVLRGADPDAVDAALTVLKAQCAASIEKFVNQLARELASTTQIAEKAIREAPFNYVE